ncbi:hypothetical protein TNCV_4922521 [Trichonephila clavipes]|nr:hypothetical protein TNCV_4922521 [Trichonephila clavipes]
MEILTKDDANPHRPRNGAEEGNTSSKKGVATCHFRCSSLTPRQSVAITYFGTCLARTKRWCPSRDGSQATGCHLIGRAVFLPRLSLTKGKSR